MRAKTLSQPTSRSWLIRLAALLGFLIEVIFVQMAFSPFRTPKMLLAFSGITVLCASAVILSLIRGHLRSPFGKLPLILLALPVIQALSALWAPSPLLSLRNATLTATWIFGALTLSTAKDEDRRFVLYWTLAGCVVSGLVLIAQVAHVDAFMLSTYSSGNRLGLAGLAGNPTDYAISALLLLPFLLPQIEKTPRKLSVWVLPAFLLLASLMSQNLTAFLSVACLGTIYLFKLGSRRTFFGVLLIVLALIAALLVSPPAQRFRRQLGNLEEGNWYALLSGREDGWTAGLKMIREAPVSGIGAGQFSREFYPARLSYLKRVDHTGGRGELATHFEWAHNDLLQLEAELGIMGLLWFICFGWTLIRETERHRRLLLSFSVICLPFLLLHYPTHIALGLLPMLLLLAELLQDSPSREWTPSRRLPAILLILILATSAAGSAISSTRQLALERWHGTAEGALLHLGDMPQAEAKKLSHTIERQAAVQMLHHPAERYWLWRIVGRCRLGRGAYREGEPAFRNALGLFPHEEAEMGLGLALVGQHRLTEALYYLERACRLNPTLLAFIPDPELKEAVREGIRVPRRRQRRSKGKDNSRGHHQKENEG